MNYLYLDIETIPSQRSEIKQEIAKTIEPPGNMKKADTIAKWEIESKPELIEKKYHDTGLDGNFGEIISIAYTTNNNELIDGTYRKLDEPEVALINWFNQQLEKIAHDIILVGHNIINFDLRFIFQRSLINRIKPNVIISTNVNNRYNDNFVQDIMLMWGGYSREGWTSLAKMCKAFNIESSKTDEIDGSKVWDFIQAGEYRKVLDYNKRDVDRVRQLHKLMVF